MPSLPRTDRRPVARANIFVVHGALGSAQQMRPVADALAALGNVINIELPGHGNTPLADRAFNMTTFVDVLGDAVEAITMYEDDTDTAARPVGFGFSMGGYVALALEAQRPGSLAGIVTLGTRILWTPEVAAVETLRLDPDVITAKVPTFAAALDERHAAAGGWREMLRNTQSLLTSLGSAPVLTSESCAAVRIPVILAVGSRDDTVGSDEASTVAGWMPRAQSRVIPDIAHPIERVPVELVTALTALLLNEGVPRD
jgi:pimeloyl-ACP methyl ester carboxylesterase